MCKHKHTTIVYYNGIYDLGIGTGPEELFLNLYQCDDCGKTLGPATDDEVTRLPTEPPALDEVAEQAALDRAWQDVIESAREV